MMIFLFISILYIIVFQGIYLTSSGSKGKLFKTARKICGIDLADILVMLVTVIMFCTLVVVSARSQDSNTSSPSAAKSGDASHSIILSKDSLKAAGETDASQLISQSQAAAAHSASMADDLLKSLAPNQTNPQIIEAINGLKQSSCRACQSSLIQDLQLQHQGRSPSSSKAELLVLVSSGMQDSAIKALWEQVHVFGGRLIFKGLIDNSFKQTQSYMTRLGVVADIDPNPFDDYQIKVVPAFILVQNDRFDKVTGHIGVSEALSQVQERGDLKDQASLMLKHRMRKSA